MLSDEEKRKLIEQYSFGRDINAFALVAEVERAVLAKVSQQVHGEPLPFIPWSKERQFFDSMPAPKQEPVAYGIPNSRPTENQRFISLHHQPCGQYPELMVPLYDHPAPPQAAAAIPEWTDEQCAQFVSVAMRHVDISGVITWDDIRLGCTFANNLSAAPKSVAETQAVPNGYRLVPFPLPEPEQVRAAQLKSEIGGYICDNWAGAYDCIYELYRVMIEACPQEKRAEPVKPSPAPQVGQCLGLVRDLSSVIRSAIDDKRIKEGDEYIVYGGSRGTISNLLEWADAVLAEGN